MSIPVTIAHGDGIGPEIMASVLSILKHAHADLEYSTIEMGKELYERGFSSGIKPEAWETLEKSRILLKAPITTPQGGGVKSLNVTLRKTLGLYANVRPCIAYPPFVKTFHPNINVVIVRENEEDLYGGIEHQQTFDVVQCLKLISRPGSERIIRYAFEYAKQNNRKKVTCFSKDNIMKLTDGLFHRVFDEIRAEYPNIQSDHAIIDIGTARLANKPELFDVIVTPNLYGDIISDVAAEITGSVGLGGSANIGDHYAMFEAIHGSAPDIAGKNIANPSGLLLAAVMMLVHLQQIETAELVHNAWLKTIEDGEHTGDIYTEKFSKNKLTTEQFTQAIIQRFGQKPSHFSPVTYKKGKQSLQETMREHASCRLEKPTAKRELTGVDVFVFWPRGTANELAEQLRSIVALPLQLTAIDNRGTRVWPKGHPETFCSDHWRCRFESSSGKINHATIVNLLNSLSQSPIEFIKIENLYHFDGKPGYTKSQGE